MATQDVRKLEEYCQEVAHRARQASRRLALVSGDTKNAWLRASAMALRERMDEILAGNQVDLDRAGEFDLSDAQIDRLRLSPGRIAAMASALDEIVMLPDPVGEVIEASRRPNGLEVSRVRVPLGVVFFVYESRPNVTVDAAAICVKSGNAVILRGGKEAFESSRVLVEVMNTSANEVGLPAFAVQRVAMTDRDAVGHFLRLDQEIDVAIPRGGESLIRRVASEARMPVIKHYDGNCHVYVDRAARLDEAVRIVVDAKCRRPGVCNACESLLVHRDVAAAFFGLLEPELVKEGVELRGCPVTCSQVASAVTATDADYDTEYLSLCLSSRVVDDVDQAIEHINRHGSHHTDAIVSDDLRATREFTRGVDSAAVMVNASTRFNDGGELGLGAEIGISTDKFHARGPCGLRELTSYKYVCLGEGHVRG